MRLHSRIAAVLAVAALYAFGASASATLKVYYDPLTGNVSLDTAETRTGGIHAYGFGLNPNQTDLRFIPEGHVRISNSTLYTTNPLTLSDASLSTDVRGLVTIGNVLPTGITPETWAALFNRWGTGIFPPTETALGGYNYTDAIGTGSSPPAPEFIYGHPGREFDNRWDLFDPDTAQWASAAKLVYRPWNGELLLDTTGLSGGYVASFLLESANRFLFENYTPPTGGLSLPSASSIGLFADAIEPGRYSLGEILPTDLTSQEFSSLFSKASFIARAGFRRASFDFETDGLPFQLVVASIPEPVSATMLSLIVIGVAATVRQRRNH